MPQENLWIPGLIRHSHSADYQNIATPKQMGAEHSAPSKKLQQQ
jgi:hypothetical protein